MKPIIYRQVGFNSNSARTFFLALFLTSKFLWGATTDSLQTDRKTVSVKLFYAPQMTYRVKMAETTKFMSGHSGYGARYTSYDSDDEIPSYGDEYGFLLEFRLSEKLNLNTGLTLDRQGFSTKQTDVTLSSPSNSAWGTYYSVIEKGTFVDYQINFISHPVILNYEFGGNQNRYFYTGVGLDSKMRYSYSIKGGAIGGDKHRYSLMGNYFVIINIGTSAFLIKNFSVFVEPFYKTQIGSTFFDRGQLSLRLWSAGCRAGIKF